MNRLKIRVAILLIGLLIMGIVLTVSGASDLIKLNGNVPDFNYDSIQNLKKGDFVQGYVAYIDGSYASTITTEETYGIETDSYTSAEYFIMPLINEEDWNDEMYITITAVNKDDWDTLFRIYDATWEYYGGNENAYFPEMPIVAKVQPLDSEYEQYMVDWFMYDPPYYASEAETRQHIIPYRLVIFNTDGPYISLAVGLVILVAFAIAGTIFYVKIVKPKTVPETYQSASGNPSDNSFSESYVPPAPVPIPDIPQPPSADDFFARPAKNKPVTEVKEEIKEPEPAFIPKDMDVLDTSVLDTDNLEYCEEYAESEIGDEFDFSNDGDYDVDTDSIDISE